MTLKAKHARYALMTLVLGLSGCGGGPPASTVVDDDDKPPRAEAPARVEVTKIEPAKIRTDLKDKARSTSLVPSPTELEEAMMGAGVSVKFNSLLAARKAPKMEGDKEVVALRTGIVLTQLVVTLKTSEKPALLADLQALRTGMAAIGAGEEVDEGLGHVIEQVTADAVTRQELLLQLEHMRASAYDTIKKNAGENIKELVQAGGWLEGTHLLTRAVAQQAKTDAANPEATSASSGANLLRQPDVVRHFSRVVEGKKGGVLGPVLSVAAQTLSDILKITEKPTLTTEDAAAIGKMTGDLLTAVRG